MLKNGLRNIFAVHLDYSRNDKKALCPLQDGGVDIACSEPEFKLGLKVIAGQAHRNPANMIEIVEVLRRSEQGATRPFICRGDDDEIYFVKGHNAGGWSLVCEWICGRLGLALGLPIAPFEIVNVPPELMGLDPILELHDLGAGPAFGSREQRVTEISMAATDGVPATLQRDVLLFDWWIKNGDRNLSERGGNPNLFWEPDDRELIVIDHNVAFEFDLIF